MSFKTEIQVVNDPKYYPNGVAFPTKEEADSYGQFKLATWMASVDFRVVESSEPANYQWVNNSLVEIPSVEVADVVS